MHANPIIPAAIVCIVLAVVVQAHAQSERRQLGTDRPGFDYKEKFEPTDRRCQGACLNEGKCKAWTFVIEGGSCRLKYAVPEAKEDTCCTSGVTR